MLHTCYDAMLHCLQKACIMLTALFITHFKACSHDKPTVSIVGARSASNSSSHKRLPHNTRCIDLSVSCLASHRLESKLTTHNVYRPHPEAGQESCNNAPMSTDYVGIMLDDKTV